MAYEYAKGADSVRRSPTRAWVYIAATAIALSLFAFTIVVANLAAGAPPQADENSWAHLFQLAMGAQLPLVLLFLALADWRRRQRVIVLLAAQILAAAAAFGARGWSGYRFSKTPELLVAASYSSLPPSGRDSVRSRSSPINE